ncbi:MAG: cobalamin-binding protein [Deltaproteobacteria bacterium]|nr:MAG: cobalamin-binding protein [Deltaproteobacteria bacterium]
MVSEERIEEILMGIRDAVVSYDEEACVQLCKVALKRGIDAYEAVIRGLAAGMDIVGELYAKKEYFVPELLLCSDALYAGLDILRPHLKMEEAEIKGRLIIGVVEGDIHDIGKNLVKTMFEAAGWEVYDLGKDVKLDRFVQEQQRINAQVVGLSALMTTSMLAMPRVIEMLRAEDPNVKIMVGGAPLTRDIAIQYGADGYAPDAVAAVQEAIKLLEAPQ